MSMSKLGRGCGSRRPLSNVTGSPKLPERCTNKAPIVFFCKRFKRKKPFKFSFSLWTPVNSVQTVFKRLNDYNNQPPTNTQGMSSCALQMLRGCSGTLIICKTTYPSPMHSICRQFRVTDGARQPPGMICTLVPPLLLLNLPILEKVGSQKIIKRTSPQVPVAILARNTPSLKVSKNYGL